VEAAALGLAPPTDAPTTEDAAAEAAPAEEATTEEAAAAEEATAEEAAADDVTADEATTDEATVDEATALEEALGVGAAHRGAASLIFPTAQVEASSVYFSNKLKCFSTSSPPAQIGSPFAQ